MYGNGRTVLAPRESRGEIRAHSESELVGFIDQSLRDFTEPSLGPIAEVRDGAIAGPLASMVFASGKRIRPLFVVYGAALGGARELDGALARVATALELFHTFALIHDDIIDNAETRRGSPSLHRMYGAGAEPLPDHGEPEQQARSLAIVAGDLVLCWADMLFQAGLDGCPGARAARALFDQMKTEIMVGQALDICYERRLRDLTEEITSRIIEYKTARYTFLRPMQIGAAMVGATDEVIDRCRHLALPLGRAFQLRDDLIGAFDDGSAGKSGTTDLECGKPTELMRYAVAAASPADVDALLRTVGRPDMDLAEIEQVREILITSGAVKHVTDEIEKSTSAAMRALRELGCEPWLEERLAAHLERLSVEPNATEMYRSRIGNPV
ncbi:polyprenyl synthetase [Saccharopolyspora subtropica]|uniref:Polyprenyl synthetase n=1 Tax=Saccharopolyspora thermophila TaxID=89367 RepID=A0A917NH47_9PSEU|nr:polyprenyl synthetase family protein [Saccharopolyspora subtropica]GGJ00194.1 polyprenyl synthetase [Saccharopolyspora subtropica]